MRLLTGIYNNTLDDKGRILIPGKLKTALDGEALVATQGFDKCLWLFAASVWEEVSQKLLSLSSPFSEKNRLVLRRFIAPASEVTLDKAGRLAIPQSLRLWAGLTKDCTLLGVTKYIELWDSNAYSEYLAKSEENFKSATEELSAICF